MAAINPYLTFAGNTEAAFNFYKSVFGGEFPMVMRFKDTPENEKITEENGNKIMHISLPVGKSMLMGSDVLETDGEKFVIGNNMAISYSADTLEDAQKVFDGLSAGGKVTLPFSKQFWGDDFGMLTDSFGIDWMVSFNEKYNP